MLLLSLIPFGVVVAVVFVIALGTRIDDLTTPVGVVGVVAGISASVASDGDIGNLILAFLVDFVGHLLMQLAAEMTAGEALFSATVEGSLLLAFDVSSWCVGFRNSNVFVRGDNFVIRPIVVGIVFVVGFSIVFIVDTC